ncbi:uncharacterized protein [Mytilus edulis]|uniref:uncharacterized protein isoform X2 n=1 Tax=Mytilus edulis TaxID=6550 RepID=UPI0039EDFF9F
MKKKYLKTIKGLVFCLVLIICNFGLRMNTNINHRENCPSDTLFETVYIFHSIAEAKSNWQSVEFIVLNVLDGSFSYLSSYDCCLFGERMLSIHRSEAKIKNSYIHGSNLPELTARQYMCSTKHKTFKTVYVGLVESGMPCDPCITVKPVIYPIIKEHGTAVCAKIAFNHLNPGHLTEWFEYQKLMHVDTVLVMLQYLNDEALKVLTFYERQGFLKILPYPTVLPGQTDRGFESTNWHLEQSSHDEQVAVYTCQTYFQGYEFVAVIDFDEFIVHDKFMSYMTMLKSELLPLHPDAAGFVLNASFFLTDWGISGTGNMLLLNISDPLIHDLNVTKTYIFQEGPKH